MGEAFSTVPLRFLTWNGHLGDAPKTNPVFSVMHRASVVCTPTGNPFTLVTVRRRRRKYMVCYIVCCRNGWVRLTICLGKIVAPFRMPSHGHLELAKFQRGSTDSLTMANIFPKMSRLP